MSTSRPSNNASVLLPLEELRKLEAALVCLQETQSFSHWLVQALMTYVRECGFMPPDPAIYSRLSTSLGLCMVDQTKAALSLSAFCTLTRREHFLKFASPALTDGQKASLRSSEPFARDLFDPAILWKVIADYEGKTLVSSHLDLARSVAKGFFGGKRSWGSSSGASGSSASATSSANPPANPESSASLFDAPSKGGGYKSKGKKGKGRGGQQRGRGASRGSGRGGQNFGK